MRNARRRCAALLPGLVIVLGCSNEPAGPIPTAATEETRDGQWAVTGPEMEFDDSEIFFEFNTTDNDLGAQVFIDGVAWRRVKIYNPQGQQILDINAHKSYRELGLTELRFESAEPSPGEVLALFEPGEYAFEGWAVDGGRLTGEGELSHDFLPAAVFTPSMGETTDPDDTVIEWDGIPGAEYYEIIVENEESGLVWSVQLPGEATSVKVSPEFLEPGLEYKAEILAVSENGNKTITEGLFNTED